MNEQQKTASVKLPWRKDGLDGFSSSHGHTFDGGQFTGGGKHWPESLTVRVLTEYGRPATVELDLCDVRGGRSVSLDPATARAAAAALLAGADLADADMAHWRKVLADQRAAMTAAHLRDIAGRAGETA